MIKIFLSIFRSMWTEKFQIYKLSLEKTEEPEMKLPTIVNHWESKGIPGKKKKKTYFCFIDYVKVFVSVDHSKLWKILKLEIPDYLTCLLSNLYETASCSQEAAVRTRHGTIDWFKIGKNIMTRLFIMTLLI